MSLFFALLPLSSQDLDIGLRIYEDNKIIPIAVKEDDSTKLKIRKNGTTYSIQLVDPESPSATKILTRIDSKDMAWKKYSLLTLCDSSNIVFIVSWMGRQSCPPGYAAFAIDDPVWQFHNSITLACCPLPHSDILTNRSHDRGKSCGSNEVTTGCYPTGGEYRDANFICTEINTSLYTLGEAKTTCYLGRGYAGQGSAERCYTPIPTVEAILGIWQFGADACVGDPYGSLITEKTSRYCSDMKAKRLFYKDTGKPAPMFPSEEE